MAVRSQHVVFLVWHSSELCGVFTSRLYAEEWRKAYGRQGDEYWIEESELNPGAILREHARR